MDKNRGFVMQHKNQQPNLAASTALPYHHLLPGDFTLVSPVPLAARFTHFSEAEMFLPCGH